MPTAMDAQTSSISDCPEILASSYCLNGSTCFSVKIQDSVMYNCWCRSGFHGARCDYKYTLNRQAYSNGATQGLHSNIHHHNQSAQQFEASNRDRNQHQQDDQDSMEALNLGFVEVVKLQQGTAHSGSASRRVVPSSRQRLQTDKETYLIVFCCLSFLFSVLLIIWLIRKYIQQSKQPAQRSNCIDSSNQQELADTSGMNQSRLSGCTQEYSIDLGYARIVESSNLDQRSRRNHLDRALAERDSINLNYSCSDSGRPSQLGRSSFNESSGERQLTNCCHATDCNYFHNSGLTAWARQDNEQQPPPRGALYVAAALANRPASQPCKQQQQAHYSGS